MDRCNTTLRQYCKPMIDLETEEYYGQCQTNTSRFEYFPTYIQFPGRIVGTFSFINVEFYVSNFIEGEKCDS